MGGAALSNLAQPELEVTVGTDGADIAQTSVINVDSHDALPQYGSFMQLLVQSAKNRIAGLGHHACHIYLLGLLVAPSPGGIV